MPDKSDFVMGKTGRGFARMEFTDRSGVTCSLQQSSLAFEDCVWFGCNDIGLRKFTPDVGWEDIVLENGKPPGTTYLANTRMHLTREQVSLLLPHLKRFVRRGSL